MSFPLQFRHSGVRGRKGDFSRVLKGRFSSLFNSVGRAKTVRAKERLKEPFRGVSEGPFRTRAVGKSAHIERGEGLHALL